MANCCLSQQLVSELTEKPRGYEDIPFRLIVEVEPEFRNGSSRESLPLISGGHTSPLQIERAAEETEKILRHYRRRVASGDRRALGELLDLNPWFAYVEWVTEAACDRLRNGLPLHGRGRPKGSICNPILITALVDYLVKSRRAKNQGEAFKWLAGHFPVSLERVRALYYEGRDDSRLRSILIQNPLESSTPSAAEVEALLTRAGRSPEEPATIITGAGVIVSGEGGRRLGEAIVRRRL